MAAPPPPTEATSTHRPAAAAATSGGAGSKAHYVQMEVYPWTNLICNRFEFVEGDTQRAACRALLEKAATPTQIGLKAKVIPMCEDDLFWHSCEGVDEADQDGFHNCKHVECADSSAWQFLTNACAEVEIQDEIDRMYNAVCGTTRPEPPGPPTPPPKPPRPPPPPSSPEFVAFRNASTEVASDLDCEPVTYRECADAAQSLHGQNPRVSPHVEIVVNTVCTGNEDENLGVSCFVGCALGTPNFMPPQYTYLSEGADATFMSRRCADNLLHDLCLCRANPLPPPPPPLDESEPVWAGVTDDLASTIVDGVAFGQPTGYYRRVATGSAFPLSMQEGATKLFSCPYEADTEAPLCTRHCANELKFRARGFTIQGQAFAPSPPPPAPPPAPPSPPPPFPMAAFYHGANDQCTAVAADGQPPRYCADGGRGSFLPTLCPYGSQNLLCGPREDPRETNMGIPGDNSCGLPNNVCEDGGPGSVPGAIVRIHDDGRIQTLCAIGTDDGDCPQRFAVLGPESFMRNDTDTAQGSVGVPRPPAPHPPPSPPSPPAAPSPPPFFNDGTHCSSHGPFNVSYARLFGAANVTDLVIPNETCSDGGIGAQSYRIRGELYHVCDFGGQVEFCGRRAIPSRLLDGNDQVAESVAQCGSLIDNGVCDDSAAKSFQDFDGVDADGDPLYPCNLGSGEDTNDCGPRPVQFSAGAAACSLAAASASGPRRRLPTAFLRGRRLRRHRRPVCAVCIAAAPRLDGTFAPAEKRRSGQWRPPPCLDRHGGAACTSVASDNPLHTPWSRSFSAARRFSACHLSQCGAGHLE